MADCYVQRPLLVGINLTKKLNRVQNAFKNNKQQHGEGKVDGKEKKKMGTFQVYFDELRRKVSQDST